MRLVPRNSLFNSAFDLFDDANLQECNLMKTDLYEKDGQYYMDVDLPGFSKENISLDYDKGNIIITATKEQKESEEQTYYRKERFYGEYTRTFYVGEIDEESIRASYNEGVLQVKFMKLTEKPTKKQITVE